MDALDTPGAVRDDPHVQAATRLAEEFAPDAERVDASGVTRGRVARIAAAGLLGLTGPATYGGSAAPVAVVREVSELLAGADGATWFVAAQHRTPLETVAASSNRNLRERWLRQLCTGQKLAGVAFSHLRRPGKPAVAATPVEDGWRIDGTVGWLTGWGICEVFLLAAQTPDERHLFALVPAAAQPGLTDEGLLPLAAMSATATTRILLDGLVVRSADVAALVPRAQWLTRDAQTTANATPQVFGLVRAVVRRLHEVAAARAELAGAQLADALAAEAAGVRAAAYRLVDEVPAAEQIDQRLALRAHALELAVRASAALVAAGAGGSMSLGNPAQRLAREALFHLVAAQTAPGRAATLRRFGELGAQHRAAIE